MVVTELKRSVRVWLHFEWNSKRSVHSSRFEADKRQTFVASRPSPLLACCSIRFWKLTSQRDAAALWLVSFERQLKDAVTPQIWSVESFSSLVMGNKNRNFQQMTCNHVFCLCYMSFCLYLSFSCGTWVSFLLCANMNGILPPNVLPITCLVYTAR